MAKTSSSKEISHVGREFPAYIWAGLIVVITLLAYIPVLRGGFIWDDDDYITENQELRSLAGLGRIWTEPAASPRYYPLVFTGFWTEYHLWELRPFGYHLVNVLLHAANAVLIWKILERLRIPGAWLAGLVFALHPVNVATVAWVTELKNTLSMFFYALAILFYLRFDEEERRRWYWLSLGAFLLALFSKTAVVMLPLVLLGCMWWLRGRVRWKDLLRSAPFFALSAAMSLVSILVENRSNQTISPRTTGFLSHLAGAGWATWFYLYKVLLPIGLTVVYPLWKIDASNALSYVPVLVLIGGLALFWWKRKSWGRPLLFGLGYFVMTLFPVLGFFDISYLRYSLVADHWQYHAIVAPVVLVVAGGVLIYRRLSEQGWYWGTIVGLVLLMTLGFASWERSAIYADTATLWRDNVEKNPDAAVAQYHLANALSRAGQLQEAIDHYERAVQIKPDYEEARSNLAFCLLHTGRLQSAIEQLEEFVQIDPRSVEAHFNLGIALAQAGRIEDAIGHYQEAVRLKPDFAEAHYMLAIALAKRANVDGAISHLQTASRLQPNSEQFRQTLEKLQQLSGRHEVR
jgi:protein O-mannosyl-transferase